MTLGEFISSKRRDKKITLRAFCIKFGYDPVQFSELETGRYATSSIVALKRVAHDLELTESEFDKMVELARYAEEKCQRPLTDEEIAKKLPAFICPSYGENLANVDLHCGHDPALLQRIVEAQKTAGEPKTPEQIKAWAKRLAQSITSLND